MPSKNYLIIVQKKKTIWSIASADNASADTVHVVIEYRCIYFQNLFVGNKSNKQKIKKANNFVSL